MKKVLLITMIVGWSVIQNFNTLSKAYNFINGQSSLQTVNIHVPTSNIVPKNIIPGDQLLTTKTIKPEETIQTLLPKKYHLKKCGIRITNTNQESPVSSIQSAVCPESFWEQSTLVQ